MPITATLSLVPGASDTPIANSNVHVASLAADESLVSLNLPAVATNLDQRSALQGQTYAMEHEPCGGLSHAKRTGKLARANAILSRGNQPHGRQPLIESKRAVLKNGPDFDGELLPGVLMLALPQATGGNELYFLAPAGRANHAVWPTLGSEELEAGIRVGEEDDCFLKSARGLS